MNTEIAHAGGGRSWLTVAAVLGIIAIAVALRMVWTEADPPIHTCSGATHVDESWMHSARNKALWGSYDLPNDQWRTELVSYPTQWLTALIFSTLGVSTTSLRLAPQLLGVLLAVLTGLIAWRVWGRRAGLTALLLASITFPLITFSRVAMVEGFLVPVVVLLLLLIQLQLEGKRVGALIGATAALCFAIKASAVLFLIPIFLGLLAVVIATRSGGQGVFARLKNVGALGIIAGGLVGAAIFYALVIHGNEAQWWFSNFKAQAYRATPSLKQYAIKFILLPTESEAVLIALGPVVALAAIEGICGLCLLKRRLWGGAAGQALDMREQWRIFLSVTTILSIVFLLAMDTNGRRVLHLAPMMILLASAMTTPSREAGRWQDISKTWRVIILLAGMPLVYVAARGLYSAITQTGRWLATGEVWSAPFLMDRHQLFGAGGVELGVFGLLFAVGLILAVWRPTKVSLAKVVWPLIVLGCAQQLAYTIDYFNHRTFTVVTAQRGLAELVPPGTPVIGNSANAACWENKIRPIFSYPGIVYANRDESVLASWNAPYVLLNIHGPLPDESRMWDDYDKFFAVESSSFWRAYNKVVAVFPIYDTSRWGYTRDDCPGYFVLLKKGEPSSSPASAHR